MNKKEILYKWKINLKHTFSDMGIVEVESNDTVLICSFGESDFWQIEISKYGLTFRRAYEIHDKLILIANEIRKEYYNVI